MFNPKVTTSYTTGTIINMDANDTLNFITGLSITVINSIRDTVEEDDGFGRMITKSRDCDEMYLIKSYNSGSPSAIRSCIMQVNADILLNFVQDIVLNETTRGLYLFYHKARNNGNAPYDLVVKALDGIHKHYMTYGNDNYKNNKEKYYNRYNEAFLKLIHGK